MHRLIKYLFPSEQRLFISPRKAFNFLLKKLEIEERVDHKLCRRMEIIKIRMKINKL